MVTTMPLSSSVTAQTPHVAICIATYRRPEGLVRLLHSLASLAFGSQPSPRITIVIIDNDATGTLHPAVAEAIAASPLIIRRYVEPTRGLAAVRNACLDRSPADSNFLAFVDDDEWVEPQWLHHLLEKQQQTGATIVQGPVKPRYDMPPQSWLADTGIYEVGPFSESEHLSYGATGNVLISRAALTASGARFHDRFNLSGGEDVDFFSQLQRAGNAIVAAPTAVAYEDVPADRLTLAWALRRRFRTGHSLGLIARHHGGITNRILKALARTTYGTAVALVGMVSSRTRVVRGLLDIAWGLGTLAAFTPLHLDQYSHR